MQSPSRAPTSRFRTTTILALVLTGLWPTGRGLFADEADTAKRVQEVVAAVGGRRKTVETVSL